RHAQPAAARAEQLVAREQRARRHPAAALHPEGVIAGDAQLLAVPAAAIQFHRQDRFVGARLGLHHGAVGDGARLRVARQHAVAPPSDAKEKSCCRPAAWNTAWLARSPTAALATSLAMRPATPRPASCPANSPATAPAAPPSAPASAPMEAAWMASSMVPPLM